METVSREEAGLLYAQLAERTRSGELKWAQVPTDSDLLPSGGAARRTFRCEFEGRSWVLLDFAVKSYDGENDEWYWADTIQLSILGGGNGSAYDFPFHHEIQGLLDAVKGQTSDVKGLLAKILKKKS